MSFSARRLRIGPGSSVIKNKESMSPVALEAEPIPTYRAQHLIQIHHRSPCPLRTRQRHNA